VSVGSPAIHLSNTEGDYSFIMCSSPMNTIRPHLATVNVSVLPYLRLCPSSMEKQWLSDPHWA
jgi:hypothetical protein